MHANEGYGITELEGILKVHTNNLSEESQAEFWSELAVFQ